MTPSWFNEYIQRVIEALRNEDVRRAVGNATTRFARERHKLVKSLPYYEYYKTHLREAKKKALDNIDEMIKVARENAEKRGAVFYYARTGEEAVKYIINVLKNAGVKLVVKSKSMTSEEIFLNKALLENEITVIETDIGEFLVQLRDEKPSHPVVPAIHLSLSEVARTLSKFLGREIPPDYNACVRAIREHLREKYVKADAGISGANAIAANTGTVIIVENEGNARLVSTLPRLHVVIAGIEKLYPTIEDAMFASMLMAPNAAGIKMPSYISFITGLSSTSDIELVSVMGAQGPLELHIVLLDNGRTRMLQDPDFREALMCLRCGACMNVCPVYREVSGLVWGYVYVGGIGAVWTAFTHGLDKAAPLAFTCLTCGRCRSVCPMEIDVPKLILKLRRILVESGYVPPQVEAIAKNIETHGNPYGAPELAQREEPGFHHDIYERRSSLR